MFYQRDGFGRPSAFLIILEDKSMIVKIGAKEIEMTSSALTSLAYKYLISVIPYLNIANLSIPVPNANPEYFSGSYPFISKTLG